MMNARLQIGSLLFTLGSFGALFTNVTELPFNNMAGVLVPYIVGGCAYFIGTAIMFWGSLKAHGEMVRAKKRAASQLQHYEIDQAQRVFAGRWKINYAKGEEDAVSQPLLCAEKDKHMLLTTAAADELLQMQLLGNFWARNRFLLDMSGSVLLFLGVNSYNVMVLAQFWDLTSEEHAEYVTLPCNLGGLGFVSGTYLLWAGCTESWFGVHEERTITWWIATLNLIGSICFLAGGALHMPVPGPGFFVPDYLEVFFGYFFGSVVFSISSYLMIVELAREEDFDEAPETMR